MEGNGNAGKGNGWCVDEQGNEETAQKVMTDATYSMVSSTCNEDMNCAGFAFSQETREAILYTTTGCTKNCHKKAWTKNPNLIKSASWCCGKTRWENAVCYRKQVGKYIFNICSSLIWFFLQVIIYFRKFVFICNRT